jgi:hypothetical protein
MLRSPGSGAHHVLREPRRTCASRCCRMDIASPGQRPSSQGLKVCQRLGVNSDTHRVQSRPTGSPLLPHSFRSRLCTKVATIPWPRQTERAPPDPDPTVTSCTACVRRSSPGPKVSSSGTSLPARQVHVDRPKVDVAAPACSFSTISAGPPRGEQARLGPTGPELMTASGP